MDFIEIRFDKTLPVDRDDVEDELNEVLAGVGEVSGAGSGAYGAHLDVDIDPGAPRDEVVDRVLSLLSGLGLAGLARLRPGDGTEWVEVGAARNGRNEGDPGASSTAASPSSPHGQGV